MRFDPDGVVTFIEAEKQDPDGLLVVLAVVTEEGGVLGLPCSKAAISQQK